MRTLGFAVMGMLVVGAGAYGWHAVRTGVQSQMAAPSGTQPANRQAPSAAASASESHTRLGPFSIAGRDYTVELQTRKVRPGSSDDAGDTVVGMEIQDAAGAVQFRRAFPYVEGTADYFESWSASAQLLTGTNGTGLLVNYNTYSEPSAPEQEPTGWFQVFGVLHGKLVPFGTPLEVQGGLLDEYADGHTYKAAQPLGPQTDEVDFKVWTGHCRLIYPVRVDWSQGKLSPAQECIKSAGGLSAGCQYKVVPEDEFYRQDITFVRLWPDPGEKSGQAVKTVVKKDSKVDLLTALAATQWMDGNAAGTSADSKGPMNDAGNFGVISGGDLWLKVRIDGKEGWMHSEEDFHTLGLPGDE